MVTVTTLEQLGQENEQLKKELEILAAINNELVSEIESIKVKPQPVNHPSRKSNETFEHEGNVYGFVYPGINYKGHVITADEILSSPALQAELVAIKSGMLKIIS